MSTNAQLAAYELVASVIEAYVKSTGKETISLHDRAPLYQCIKGICEQKPDSTFPFHFRKRGGQWSSPDIDLVIRNLEDSGRLRCFNPDMVEFAPTDVLRLEYEECIHPRLKELGLLSVIDKACNATFAC